MDEDDECCRAAIVRDQVAHQHVHDVIVEAHPHITIVIITIVCGIEIRPPARHRRFSAFASRGSGARMIKHINFVSVPCADQKRALEFYTKRLGLAVFTDQPFDEAQRWIELKVANAQTKLVLFTSDEYKD